MCSEASDGVLDQSTGVLLPGPRQNSNSYWVLYTCHTSLPAFCYLRLRSYQLRHQMAGRAVHRGRRPSSSLRARESDRVSCIKVVFYRIHPIQYSVYLHCLVYLRCANSFSNIYKLSPYCSLDHFGTLQSIRTLGCSHERRDTR